MTERTAGNHKAIADKERLKIVIQQALAARETGEGIFAQEIVAPEVPFIQLTKDYAQKINSEVYPLHSVFFLSSILFADNSWRQLKRVSQKTAFQRHAWLFNVEEVANSNPEEVFLAVSEYFKPGYNGAAATKWHHNATLIVENYNSDLRNFFAEHSFSAPQIRDTLIGPKNKTSWEGFHRFGPKLARLFLMWVDQYDLASLQNTDRIGVPVDFQVSRIAIQTKSIKPLEEKTHREWIQHKLLVPLLEEICREENLPSHVVAETLWFIGSIGCNNYLHDLCPLAEYCTMMISRVPSDQSGVFILKDVGRNKTVHTPTAQHLRSLAAGQLKLPLE